MDSSAVVLGAPSLGPKDATTMMTASSRYRMLSLPLRFDVHLDASCLWDPFVESGRNSLTQVRTLTRFIKGGWLEFPSRSMSHTWATRVVECMMSCHRIKAKANISMRIDILKQMNTSWRLIPQHCGYIYNYPTVFNSGFYQGPVPWSSGLGFYGSGIPHGHLLEFQLLLF